MKGFIYYIVRVWTTLKNVEQVPILIKLLEICRKKILSRLFRYFEEI